jgi:hypothetical protein
MDTQAQLYKTGNNECLIWLLNVGHDIQGEKSTIKAAEVRFLRLVTGVPGGDIWNKLCRKFK